MTTRAHGAVLDGPGIISSVNSKVSAEGICLPVLERSSRRASRFVIAEDVDGEALRRADREQDRAAPSVRCAVKAPASVTHRRRMRIDMAILTGGQVISAKEVGLKLDSVEPGAARPGRVR